MRRLFCLPVLLCLILYASSEARSQFSFNRIAITGEPASVFVAGNPESMVFDSFSGAIIDKDGNIILAGSIESQTGPEEGIWFHRRSLSRLDLHVKENRPAPHPSADAVFGSLNGEQTFGALKLLNGTQFTYRARLRGGNVTSMNDTATYRRGREVLREGRNFTNEHRIGDQFEFEGLAEETARSPFPLLSAELSRDTALQMGDLSLLVEGSELSGGLLGDLRNARPLVIPRSIDVVFRGTVTGAGGTLVPNNETIFAARFTGSAFPRPTIIARQGGGPANARDVRFDSLYEPAAALDRVFFGVRLSGINVGPSNDSAIAQKPPFFGEPFLLLREGDVVAGAEAGVMLGDLGADNLVGGGGLNLIFNNQLVGPDISEQNDWALISAEVDMRGMLNTRALAQEGNFVEGLPAGSALAGLNAPHFQLNLVGDVIFNAQFVGPNGNGDGLFYTRLDQTVPSLIVRTGQEFDIGGGVFRTISDIGLIEMSNPWDGRAAQINDRGEIAFGLTFSDGSQGIFTTVVPEPATIVLACVGGLLIFVSVWRCRLVR